MAAVDPAAQEILTCDLCSDPVELYCNPCNVNLCAVCSPNHMRSNLAKTHNIVLYTQRALEPIHPKCISHSDQNCVMFCKKCDIPICIKCVTSSHKKHNFIDIEEHALITSMKTVIERDNNELEKAIIPTYEGVSFELQKDASRLQQEYNKTQTNIDQHGVQWHREIDIIVKKQKNEAQKMKEENSNRLKINQTETQAMLSLSRDVLKKNKNLMKSNNDAEIKKYKSQNKELRNVPVRVSMTIPSFTPIQIHGEYLSRQFGKVSAAIESEIEKFKIKQLTKPEIDINVETETDGLFGISYLPVDKLWIHGNEETIDLIDVQGTILDSVKTLSGNHPQGLTVTKEGHLVYGDYTTGNTNLVKNGETKTIIRLPLRWVSYDMCFSLSDDLLILMYKVPGYTECKVVRYDKDYEIKQEIQYDDKGAPLYTAGEKLMYIAENKNTDICVANYYARNVVTVNQSGKLRWRYRGNLASHKYDSFTPGGIATDSQCHVLVADYDNDCVHLIGKEGQFILYIEKCGMDSPHVMCVDTEDRLFVGQSMDPKSKVALIRYLK